MCLVVKPSSPASWWTVSFSSMALAQKVLRHWQRLLAMLLLRAWEERCRSRAVWVSM